MIKITRTSIVNQDFLSLITDLDRELVERYGEKQSDLDKNNVVSSTRNIAIAYREQVPVGCGCYRLTGTGKVEIKRMYVIREFRGRGISKMILHELEKWAHEEGFKAVVLETGKKQHEAINLYVNRAISQLRTSRLISAMG